MIPKKSITSFSSGAIAPLLLAASAHAAVVISQTGTRNDNYSSGSNLSGTLSATATDTVFFIFSADNTGPLVTSATYGSDVMTLVQDDRVTIGYVMNPTTTSGSITLNTLTGGGLELAYWGVASGVGGISSTTGSNVPNTTTHIMNNSLSGLVVGDIVYAGFAVNNVGTSDAYGPTPSPLAKQDGGSGDHDAVIQSYLVTTNGSLTPSVSRNTGFTAAISGVAVAFSAIPEPSALLFGCLGALGILRRRR